MTTPLPPLPRADAPPAGIAVLEISPTALTAVLPRPVVCVASDGSPAAATALPIAQAVATQLAADLERLTIGEGDAASAILRAIADPRTALMVLTTHGRELGSYRGLGRVAAAVMARAEKPILLVRPEAATVAGGAAQPLRRLLLPLDGSPGTTMGLTPAIALAGRLGASVDLLCIAHRGQTGPREPGSIPMPRYVDQPQHEWPHWVQNVLCHVTSLCGEWPPDMAVHAFLTSGEPGSEILRVASAQRHDAIVLVRRSRLEPGRAAVLRAVVAAMPCPTLLVGLPAEELSSQPQQKEMKGDDAHTHSRPAR